MIRVESKLPWTGKRVHVISDIAKLFRAYKKDVAWQYLPKAISLFVDREVETDLVLEFTRGMITELDTELRIRRQRSETMERLGLVEHKELESFLTKYTDTQHWAIYYGLEGGLGSDTDKRTEPGQLRGVIPCASLRNHGVAWEWQNDKLHVFLATTRKKGNDWDWNSDIGHESGHAAFAPVPLFVQSANLLESMLHIDGIVSQEDLEPRHIARLIYAYSELLVVALRGEQRDTETGTPVGQREELCALLRISHDLMPTAGFDHALSVYEGSSGRLDVRNDTAIYRIVIPMLKVLPLFGSAINSFEAPSVDDFKETVTRMN